MEFNIEPYHDDFKQNAEDNNYMRILFKPGYAVQARELTQIQSILQNQIKQFGDHIFQDGSPVIGGNLSLDNTVKYVKLLETYNNTDIEITDFQDKVIRNTDGTAQAKVLAVYFPEGGTPTLMVKYLTGIEFSDGAVIRIVNSTTEAQLIASNATGRGTIVSVNEGVFYVDGYFVKVSDQSAVVSPYSTSANVKIGLEIDEGFIYSENDSTLLDPAQGSFNYQAPGADRYQFNLTLSTRPLDTVVDESKFFELMRVEEGTITKQVKYPVYAELEKTLARRTFDESGDYTVKPFRATLQEGADANNYVIALEPGKAYVKGFEFETLGTVKMEVAKPRSATDTKTLVDTDVDLSYGNYVYSTGLRGSSNGFFDLTALPKVDIHCVDTTNVTISGTHSGTANAWYAQNTKIGTARVRNFLRYAPDLYGSQSSNVDSNGTFKLHLSDVNIKPIVTKVTAASSNANTVRLPLGMSPNSNAYLNVSATILPIRLDALNNVNTANIFVNSYRLNANSLVSSVLTPPNVNVGSVIHVGGMVREVVSIDTSGAFLTVNTAWDRTIEATSSTTNPLQVFVQSSYSQGTTNQTRNIIRYDGSSRTAFFDRNFDGLQNPDANSVVSLNFNFFNAESFVGGPITANNLATAADVSMNVSSLSKYLGGETAVEERLKNGLIFKLPGSYIKRSSIDNCDYNHNKFIPNRSPTSSGSGIFQISQGSGLGSSETIPWADSTSSVQDNLIVIVRSLDTANTYFPVGSVLQLSSANVTIGSPATSLTIDTGIPDIATIDILTVVKENDADDSIRLKTLVQDTSFVYTSSSYTYPTSATGATTVTLPTYGTVAQIDSTTGIVFLTDPTYNSVRPGDAINLFVPDVIKVRRIIKGNTTHLPQGDANTSDITDHFFIDYGQRDDMYDHAKLILKEGYNVANAKILVHLDFYTHTYTTTNTSFFSADSYSETQYNNGTIPVYISENGDVYNLRDCLDFRPTRQLGSATGAFQSPNIPSADEVAELSLQYYLPRIDKLVLSKDKEFRIIKGQSAAQPVAPADVDDAMTMYTIILPPYVSNLNEIRLLYKENRRYTMKDISKFDKRIEQLEFYTTLNTIESLALSDPTQYEDGTQKEKYGIVGENFKNFNIADYRNKDFAVSLNNGFMLPAVSSFPVPLQTPALNRTNTKVSRSRKTLTLRYDYKVSVKQWYASQAITVQPFLFGSFIGGVELNPESDFWVNQTLKPETISLPERVITQSQVIRETIVEPSAPDGVPTPTKDASTQYTSSPGSDIVDPASSTLVPVSSATPPPYVPPTPAATARSSMSSFPDITLVGEIPDIPIETNFKEPPLDKVIEWADRPTNDITPVTIPATATKYGAFDETLFYPIQPIQHDKPQLDNTSYVPSATPITTNPIVLGTSPLDSIASGAPIIRGYDLSRSSFSRNTVDLDDLTNAAYKNS